MQNEGFLAFRLRLTTGCHLVLRRNYGIWEADGCPRTPTGAMLPWLFRLCCSAMYAAVSDINYIVVSVMVRE